MSLEKSLTDILEGEVSVKTDVIQEHSEDTSIFHIEPTCVVYPKHTEDVKKLVNYAADSGGMVSLTARSAGTDMSGGPLTNSVAVNFLKHFTKIKDVSATQATAEPGVFYRDFDKETLKFGVILPSYTASRELNTVGGMVANNSAGEKSLIYGKTERWVRALKVVLSDGNEYEFKKLSFNELQAKKAQDNFEGQFYREMESLIKDNIDLIESEAPTVSKNSAGYAVWNVWDREEDSFDLIQLFVGSQGTLGLITEITFDLIKPKPHSRMLVMFLRKRHMKVLGDLVNIVLKEKPESFESYDDKTFSVMLRIFPKLIGKLGGNPFKVLWGFLPETKMILTGGIPKMVLMAEFAGDTEEGVIAAAKKAEAEVLENYAVSTHVTRTKNEAQKFWTIRRESFKLLRENVHGKHTAPFIDDISVRPELLPEFLPKLYEIMADYKLLFTIAGHIGDGNFHIIPLMDFSRPDFTDIIKDLSERVYTLVGEYDGSITGEHNDGLIRTPYLNRMFSDEMLMIFQQAKNILDPQGIFNPHKKVNGDMDLLFSSIKKNVKD
ncbi:MAG: FAD-binding oxidoreductase [Candidatus Pacebacteria bacterium]|nr:FAD-binding oxidoreductase [Candidatus Paceibacterota bacterium]